MKVSAEVCNHVEARPKRYALVGSILLAFAVGIAGCERTDNSANAPVVATVGQQKIDAALLDYYIEQKAGIPSAKVGPDLRQKLKSELIALAAAAEAGERLDSSKLRPALELARMEVLSRAAAEHAGVNAPPTDDEIQKAYKDFVTALPSNEYHVAHILAATEPLATAVIARLNRGEHFADVAASASADDSRARGGDLGWISPGHLPPAFMDAAQSLKVGSYTQRPVQTAYGWHVIRLLETRTSNAPPLESVRPQIIANIQAQKYQRFLQASLAAVKQRSP